MSELENARLVRLLCKFGFINERPEYASLDSIHDVYSCWARHNHETRGSETGDRYIVKLFRDYLFHQVDEMGRPVVNLSHVLACLNKLDAGTDERIMLVSRDEQSCLVVSYREVKACIESAFGCVVAAFPVTRLRVEIMMSADAMRAGNSREASGLDSWHSTDAETGLRSFRA